MNVGDTLNILVDHQDGFYAKVRSIKHSSAEWYELSLLVFTHPLQEFCWILNKNQINGSPFLMGDTVVQLEIASEASDVKENDFDEKCGIVKTTRQPAKVIQLADRRK